jgi:formylglycine-generating enzyme required for sulfatase activity
MRNNKIMLIFLFAIALLVVGCDEDPYKEWDSSAKIEMVWIEGGTFLMGSPDDEAGRDIIQSTYSGVNWFDVEKQHSVTITKGFYIGKYPITQEQYVAVEGRNHSKYERKDTIFEFFIGEEKNFPAENMTWYDAVNFCNMLSMREKLKPVYKITDIERGTLSLKDLSIISAKVEVNWNANGYRLPTEAEWEYACRAGSTTPFNTGNDITKDQAYFGNAYKDWGSDYGQTMPVGRYAPNAFGLYDMHGLIKEWCWDWFGDYENMPQTNPKGAAVSWISPALRIVRGGSWGEDKNVSRSACRTAAIPDGGFTNIGFRVVRNK